jgi:tRNA G18 (ribose-2'-O)-methylase SpoU
MIQMNIPMPETVGARVLVLSDSLFDSISEEKSPDGIISIAKYIDKFHKIVKIESTHLNNEEIFCFEDERIVILENIRDPGNLGTILRIAEWFGIDAVFATKDSVDVFNPKVVQATMGAIFRVKMHYVDLPALSKLILQEGGQIYGTFLDGRNIYGRELATGEDFPVMIVIGNESEGISDKMASLTTDRLYIPPYPIDNPGSESLNSAVATAVTVAEFRRRNHVTHNLK